MCVAVSWSLNANSPLGFVMKKEHYVFPLHEVVPYIHWSYFFHAWGFSPRFATIADVHGCDACRAMWLASFPEEERRCAAEAMQLYKEACRMLVSLDTHYTAQALCRLCEAYADGDDLVLDGIRFPLLRQQTKQADNDHYLCLSDFVRPFSPDVSDCVGVFVASVRGDEGLSDSADPYRNMLVQTLADRLAEAAAERMHEHVRRHFWGYAPDERLTVRQLHNEAFQGIRPAVGYPSLPDQSVNFILDSLLDFSSIGVSLTEHGAMNPHASVSGLMLAHPAARYFSIGRISYEQLSDYALRRSMPVEKMAKFLRPLLS